MTVHDLYPLTADVAFNWGECSNLLKYLCLLKRHSHTFKNKLKLALGAPVSLRSTIKYDAYGVWLGSRIPAWRSSNLTALFNYIALVIIPPPRQTLLSYTAADWPGVTAHCFWPNLTVISSLLNVSISQGASGWR